MQFGISECIEHWGKYAAESIAICCDGKEISYAQLNSCVNCLGSKIENSTEYGSRVAIAIESKLLALMGILAVSRACRSAVVLHLGVSEEIIQVNLNDTQPSAMLFDLATTPFVGSFEKNCSGSIWNICEELELTEKSIANHSVKRRGEGEDEWGIVFSSGSTGPSKGIVRNNYSMVTELMGWCMELELRRGSVMYVGRPIFYTGGLVLALATLSVGGCVIIDDIVDWDNHQQVWNSYQKILSKKLVDWAFFIPDQIRAFCRIVESGSAKTCRAGNILVMGAPISADEKINSSQILGSTIIESWGNSEGLGTITTKEDLFERPRSIGHPFLTDELFIVDTEGRHVDPGISGRIAGGIEAGFSEYSNRQNATECVRRKNLIISDDIGYMDEAGYFYITGRQQDCVIINGITVVLPEIEAIVRKEPYISECAIVAQDSSENTTSLIVMIVPNSHTSALIDGIKNQLDIILDGLMSSSQLIIRETLPRLPSGKVDREAVQREAKGSL